MDTDTAAIGIGAATAGSLLTGIGAWVVNFLKAKYDQDRQVRKDTIDELYKLNEQMRRDVDLLENKYVAIQKEHVDCQIKYTRLVERLEHYEQLLTDAKIMFHPFRPGGGTDTHQPLPPKEGS